MAIQERDAQIAWQIKEQCSHGDLEVAHIDADAIIIKLIRELGYEQTADAWEAVDKWYA